MIGKATSPGTSVCCQAFFVIPVTDLDRAFEFYRLVFDADSHFLDRGTNSVSIKSPIQGIESLILWQVPTGMSFQPCRILGARLTCRCDDIYQTYRILSDRAVPVTPVESLPGIRFFVVTDPDDNEIGFFEFVLE